MSLFVFKPKPRHKPFLMPGCPRKAYVLRQQGRVILGLLAVLLLIFPAGVFAATGAAPNVAAVGATPDAGTVAEAAAAAKGAATEKTAGGKVFVAAAPMAGAADESAGEAETVLTYNRAVELAIKNSTELKNARESELQAEEIREKLANLRRISGFTPVGPGYDLADAADRELLLKFTAADTAWRMAAKQVEILEETIAFQVRSAYDEVLQNTAGLEKADRALAFAATKLYQTEIKTRLGVESRFNRENARSSYAAEKEQRERLACQLDEAYTNLNKLLGLEPGARPKLQEHDPPSWLGEEHGSTTGLGETGLERHLALVLHDHPYIWLQEQKAAQAERELSLYTYNIEAPPYKVVASAVQQEKNNLYALKEEVRKGVRSLYYQLQGLESQYKALEASLVQAENALRAVQLRFKLGMAVPLEIEQAELALLEIKSGMQDLARAYGQLKMLYEKPWVIPASFGNADGGQGQHP